MHNLGDVRRSKLVTQPLHNLVLRDVAPTLVSNGVVAYEVTSRYCYTYDEAVTTRPPWPQEHQVRIVSLEVDGNELAVPQIRKHLRRHPVLLYGIQVHAVQETDLATLFCHEPTPFVYSNMCYT